MMPIRKWHFGKLIILWSWGAVSSALALTHFVSTPVSDAPILHACEIVFVLLILALLSGITWHWLGAKESS
jgi:hypothetical protein